MGAVSTHRPVLLIMAVFSRYEEAIDWARNQAVASVGAVGLQSPLFSFTETAYYDSEMGTDLKKTFFAFEQLFDPGRLAPLKLQTNDWEQEYQQMSRHPEPRPVNLDPGYLTEAKLVLASTKDREHRIYLQQGVFAECTLYYQKGCWRARDWTYPDYRNPPYHVFFSQCRDYLRERLRDRARKANS